MKRLVVSGIRVAVSPLMRTVGLRPSHRGFDNVTRQSVLISRAMCSGAAGAGADADEVTVRVGRREDVPTVHRMIYELAAFEGFPDGPKLTVEGLLEDGFDTQRPWYFLVVAELRGELVGYALCNRAYSAWTRRAYYVEDIYMGSGHRRAGIGMKIATEVCRLAVAEDAHRIDWHVSESNEAALAFYAKLGARDMRETEGRVAQRLDRHRMELVANNFQDPKLTNSPQ